MRLPRLFLLCVLLAATPAWADIGIDLNKVPQIKAVTLLPQEEFNKLTRVETEQTPYDDDYLSYEIRLPKEWTGNVQEAAKEIATVDKSLSSSVLSILGRYIGPAKNLRRSFIIVESQILRQEIGVKNWFVNFMIRNGFSLNALSDRSDKELDALYVQVVDDQTYAVHARAVINGPRLILMRYYLPQENYKEERALQAQVVDSFKLLNSVEERIEEQKTYAFLDQSYFNYPVTWTLKAKPIYSIERMTATIYQQQVAEDRSVLEGQMKVDVISKLLKTTLTQELKNFREGIDIKGYSIGKVIEAVKYNYDPSIKAASAQIYELAPDDKVAMKTYEFLVAVMEGDDFYYITSMITPARDQDFMTWARNMETARIVNESLRRSNLKYDPSDPYYDYLKEE